MCNSNGHEPKVNIFISVTIPVENFPEYFFFINEFY